jgi:hypothetical protein
LAKFPPGTDEPRTLSSKLMIELLHKGTFGSSSSHDFIRLSRAPVLRKREFTWMVAL